MIHFLQLVACALTFSEVFSSVYLYGPHQNPVAIYSPYDYYYIRNLHRIQLASPNDAPSVVRPPYTPVTVDRSQIVPSRAPIAAPIVAAPTPASIAAAPATPQEGYSFRLVSDNPTILIQNCRSIIVTVHKKRFREKFYSIGKIAFSYEIEAPDGRQSRQESADAAGNVQGSYSFSLNDGRQRTVNYSAGS